VLIDTSTDFGQRVTGRLHDEIVIWLVTVDPNGTPEPSPVWFYWDDEAFLIYSLRGTPRERNIKRNPRVALHFDSALGGNVVIFTGEAHIDDGAPSAHAHAEYANKYRANFVRIGSTPERFSLRYSLPIRVRPTKLRGF
jgi:PPOX class probable F420-dependent enzyme